MKTGAKSIDPTDVPMVHIKTKKNKLWIFLFAAFAMVLISAGAYIVYVSKNTNNSTEETSTNQQGLILSNGSAPIKIEVDNKQVTGTE